MLALATQLGEKEYARLLLKNALLVTDSASLLLLVTTVGVCAAAGRPLQVGSCKYTPAFRTVAVFFPVVDA